MFLHFGFTFPSSYFPPNFTRIMSKRNWARSLALRRPFVACLSARVHDDGFKSLRITYALLRVCIYVLKRHLKIHGKNVAERLARAVLVCRTCAKECKTLAGLKATLGLLIGELCFLSSSGNTRVRVATIMNVRMYMYVNIFISIFICTYAYVYVYVHVYLNYICILSLSSRN